MRSAEAAARMGRLLAFATAGLSVIAMIVPPSSACDIGPAPWNGTPRPSAPIAFSTDEHHEMRLAGDAGMAVDQVLGLGLRETPRTPRKVLNGACGPAIST